MKGVKTIGTFFNTMTPFNEEAAKDRKVRGYILDKIKRRHEYDNNPIQGQTIVEMEEK